MTSKIASEKGASVATASLPMYDLPEVRNAHDTLWSVLAQNLRHQGVSNVPDNLVHGRSVAALWNDPDLLISQCCGYDIVHGYKNILRPIATPKFAAFGCLLPGLTTNVAYFRAQLRE